MTSHFPHTRHSLHIPSMLPSAAAACFWLVVVFWSANVFFFHYFCVAPFDVPNDGTVFPNALRPPHATSPDSLSLLMPTLGWLLCLPFKFPPLKAKATPHHFIFWWGVRWHTKQRNWPWRHQTRPQATSMGPYSWPRSHVLVAPLSYPWREKATPLGGRAAASHVGCCVFCVVVFCLGPYF